MSDYHHQLPATELDPVFQFARDTWTNSFDRFSGDPGDIDAFNRDTGNDIFCLLVATRYPKKNEKRF